MGIPENSAIQKLSIIIFLELFCFVSLTSSCSLIPHKRIVFRRRYSPFKFPWWKMIKPAVKSRVLDESQPVTTHYTTYVPEVLESQLVETTTIRSIDPSPPRNPSPPPPPNSLRLTKNSEHVSGHRVVDRFDV